MPMYIERIKTMVSKALDKPKSKMVSVNKQHLLEDIGITKKKLEIFSKCIDSMPRSYRQNLADKIFDLSSKKSVNVGCAEYVKMAKAVAGNDLRIYFSSFEICCNNFLEIIEKVTSDFNKIFDGKEVRIENVTLGQFAVFGMMEQASIFAKYCSYLMDMVSHDVLAHDSKSELSNMPQYKPVFVNKHSDLVYELARELKTGYINYLNDIKKVVNSSSNVKLINNAGESNLGMVDADEHHNNFFIRNATFNPFFIIGETWVVVRHWMFQRTVKEREYLDSHIALLKLELDGQDPDSPEYQHHVKVIDAYNKMLAELDEKISKYENS